MKAVLKAVKLVVYSEQMSVAMLAALKVGQRADLSVVLLVALKAVLKAPMSVVLKAALKAVKLVVYSEQTLVG